MDSKKINRRRATHLGVNPLKEALMAGPAVKPSAKKKSVRKVLADKTNATPVAGLVPSPAKSVIRWGPEEEGTPCSKLRPFSDIASPVLHGEDVLRSQVHKELTMTATPANGLSGHSVHAHTPQFRIPFAPYEDSVAVSQPTEDLGDAADLSEQVQAASPEASPQSCLTAAPLQSSEWVGRDVDVNTECEEDSISDCSVVVNVSSPGLALKEAASLTVADSPKPVEFTAKWQHRGSPLKVKTKDEDQFDYYDDAVEDYEGYEDYDHQEFDQDCDDLCHGISRISVAEVKTGLPEHKGRHVRFNYNSEDEIEEEEVDVLRLRGLPTPRGKHHRFVDDEEATTS